MLLLLLPLMALSLNACASGTSHSGAESSPAGSSSMAQMDHSADMSMDLGPQDESFDLRFIDAMIPHHEGAVIMAEEVLQKSSRPELQQLARDIIAAQQQEIAQMQEWRSRWYPKADPTPVMWHAEANHMMPMTEEIRNQMRMSGDLGAADAGFDGRFLDAMIPHHEGALVMAQQALEKSDRPEIRQLAQNILDSQQREIAQMQQWKRELLP